jgi:GAF domain-containing protein
VSSPEHPEHVPGDLADVFADVARQLMAEDDLDAVLSRMSALAVETVHGAQHCGITVVEGGAVRTAGANDHVPVAVDRIQYETGEGPCLDAIREHAVFASEDLTAEHRRWPRFTARATAETPVRSILSFRLFDEAGTLGALNLYSDDVHAFDGEDRHIGAVFAAHAAVAMANARKVENLERALQSRDVIATAKGMLMAQSGVGEDEAFDILRRASQRMNVKLRDVARRLVAGDGLAERHAPH